MIHHIIRIFLQEGNKGGQEDSQEAKGGDGRGRASDAESGIPDAGASGAGGLVVQEGPVDDVGTRRSIIVLSLAVGSVGRVIHQLRGGNGDTASTAHHEVGPLEGRDISTSGTDGNRLDLSAVLVLALSVVGVGLDNTLQGNAVVGVVQPT